jgi:hypothetical protein
MSRLLLRPPVTAPGPPAVHWAAECHRCGGSITADAADMARYLRDGWPPCCGHAMTFRVVRAPRPPAGETKV